jgi:hypothetical protein
VRNGDKETPGRRKDDGVMKVVTVVPLQDGGAALSDLPEPRESDAPVLVERMAAARARRRVQPDGVGVRTGVARA